MKKMKFVLKIASVLAIITFAFAACSNESSDDSGNSASGNNNNTSSSMGGSGWYKSVRVEELDGSIDEYSTQYHVQNIFGNYMQVSGFSVGAELTYARYDNGSLTGTATGKITNIDEYNEQYSKVTMYWDDSDLKEGGESWVLYSADKNEIKTPLHRTESDGTVIFPCSWTVYTPYTGTIPAPVQ